MLTFGSISARLLLPKIYELSFLDILLVQVTDIPDKNDTSHLTSGLHRQLELIEGNGVECIEQEPLSKGLFSHSTLFNLGRIVLSTMYCRLGSLVVVSTRTRSGLPVCRSPGTSYARDARGLCKMRPRKTELSIHNRGVMVLVLLTN
jgi:hypothetical protein